MSEPECLFQVVMRFGVFAKLPNVSVEKALKLVTALIDGGVRMIAVDVRSDAGVRIIKQSASQFKGRLIISAGEIVRTQLARKAILAGADIITTPYRIGDVFRTCNRYGKMCIPGALTPTEVLNALEMGAALIQLYPAESFDPGLLQAIKGPLPQANLMPAGSVDLENMAVWVRAGASAVVIEDITQNIDLDDIPAVYDTVTLRARAYIQALEGMRKAAVPKAAGH